MQQTIRSIVVSLLIVLFVMQGYGPVAFAQDPVPTAQELDQLLAPVALYPDSLLSQITTAATNPQEILDVNAWLGQNGNLTGAALTDAASSQGFDPAFIALVNFPQVLQMMADHIDDYAAIGTAFLADQGAVSASIQRLRGQAYDAGSLRTTEQQQVEVQQPAPGQTIYVIQPASPQIVYVPVYDPTIVYVRPAPTVVVTAPLITFGVGIGIGVLIASNQPWGWGGWGWNWGARRVYYNHGYWGGWGNPYRPPHIWYRPRPIVWANRPGYGGNWGYRPPHYRPPNYPQPRPLPSNPGHRPGTRPPAPPPPKPGKPGTPVKPPSNRPTNPNEPTPPPKPGTPKPPPTTRPTKPGTPGGPEAQPTKPGTPGTAKPQQPSTRPTKPTTPGGPEAQPTKPGTPGTPKPQQPSTRPTKPTTPGGPEAQPTKPGTPKPQQPSTRPANPTPPSGSTKPPPDRTAKPGQTGSTPSNRPPKSQPSSNTGGSQQQGLRPAVPADNQSDSDRKPQL